MHLFHMYGARRHNMVEPVLKEDGTPFKVAILIPTINNADELAIVLDRLTQQTYPGIEISSHVSRPFFIFSTNRALSGDPSVTTGTSQHMVPGAALRKSKNARCSSLK